MGPGLKGQGGTYSRVSELPNLSSPDNSIIHPTKTGVRLMLC